MSTIRTITKTMNYWWVFLLIGILLSGLSIGVFIYPLESLVSFTMIFSVALLLIGIAQIFFSIASSKSIKGWGWYLSGGLLDATLGILLMLNPGISIVILPFIVSFWILFRGSSLIGGSIDMKNNGFSNWGWVLAGGILNIILSMLILFNPLAGAIGVAIWMGFSILITGLFTVLFSFGLRHVADIID